MSQLFPVDIKKNKLKWAGDLEGLKLFVSDELKLKGNGNRIVVELGNSQANI